KNFILNINKLIKQIYIKITYKRNIIIRNNKTIKNL
ncbi:hypothetical protein FPSE_06354, partial [Fusarium pseudograminearum CS3096]